MTKLEEKLAELGYKKSVFHSTAFRSNYFKIYSDDITLNVDFDCFDYNGIIDGYVLNGTIDCQQDIDNLQQAFNQLQQDLEVLREYERLD